MPTPGYSEGFGGSTLDIKQKSALIGVTMLIDYSFYQIKDNSGWFLFIMYSLIIILEIKSTWTIGCRLSKVSICDEQRIFNVFRISLTMIFSNSRIFSSSDYLEHLLKWKISLFSHLGIHYLEGTARLYLLRCEKRDFSNYQTLKITLNFGIFGNFRIFAVAWALLLICLITKIWTSFKLKSPHPQKLESKWPITL